MSENLKFKMIEDGIGELILSQPKRRNALNAAMWAGLPSILKTAADTKGIKVLIVRGDGDHYAAYITAPCFKDLSRVKQHQMVYGALKGKMGNELHALAIQTSAPKD